MSYTIGFLGAGKMITAISLGIISNDICRADEIIASCTSKSSGQIFQDKTQSSYSLSNRQVAENCKILIIGVKPQVLVAVAKDVQGYINADIVISIVAGIDIASLQNYFGKNIIRVMPNTPLMIGEGATAFCCADEVSKNQRLLMHKFFGSTGIVREVEEKYFDLVTALSGSGPAFIFKYVEEMIGSAVNLGLDEQLAFDLIAQTLIGSAKMVSQKVASPAQLREMVTSPNGTTYAGLMKMQELGFDKVIYKILEASRNRSIEIGKQLNGE